MRRGWTGDRRGFASFAYFAPLRETGYARPCRQGRTWACRQSQQARRGAAGYVEKMFFWERTQSPKANKGLSVLEARETSCFLMQTNSERTPKRGQRMRHLLCFITLFAILGSAVAQTPVPDYRNPTLPIEQRVADLLKRMTLEEKVGQLRCPRAGPASASWTPPGSSTTRPRSRLCARCSAPTRKSTLATARFCATRFSAT